MEVYITNFNRDNKNPLISIVIPCRDKKEIIYKYPNQCELIIVEGNEPPGRLRDYGVKFAKGKFLAFIDSDAYPTDNWYKNVLKYIYNYDVVCGPGIIPPNSPFLERISDLILRYLPYNYRVIPCKARFVKEFPTFNLILTKEVFKVVGGFNTDMITGEDTILCRKIKYILYIPDIVVYHKRRSFGKLFFKQVSTYGYNRGILIGLTCFGWITTIICYGYNFVKGFLKRK